MPATFYIASLPFQDALQIGGYFSAAAARLITRRDKRNREVRILPAG